MGLRPAIVIGKMMFSMFRMSPIKKKSFPYDRVFIDQNEEGQIGDGLAMERRSWK